MFFFYIKLRLLKKTRLFVKNSLVWYNPISRIGVGNVRFCKSTDVFVMFNVQSGLDLDQVRLLEQLKLFDPSGIEAPLLNLCGSECADVTFLFISSFLRRVLALNTWKTS